MVKKMVTWCDEIPIHPNRMWHHSQHKLYRNHRKPVNRAKHGVTQSLNRTVRQKQIMVMRTWPI